MDSAGPLGFGGLGPLEVWAGGKPLPLGGAKQRAALALLLLHANEPVSFDRLIDALWGERPCANRRADAFADPMTLRAT
jgi:DNA-binding SARP family transcriptional activator